MSKVLLLTGSLRPSTTPFLTLTDPNIRINHYISAIKYYIYTSNFNRIVFADNTDSAREICFLITEAFNFQKKLEIISFAGNKSRVENQGKGFGECEIIEYALNKSKLISSDDLVVKITGRYEILNINKIFEKINTNYPSFIRVPGNNMIDAVVFSFLPTTWNAYFKSAIEMIDDNNGYYFEHVLYDLVKRNQMNISRLPYFPLFSQLSGTSGKLVDRKLSIYSYLIVLEVISVSSWQAHMYTSVFRILVSARNFLRKYLIRF